MGELKQFPDRFKKVEEKTEDEVTDSSKIGDVISFSKKVKPPEKIEVGGTKSDVDLFSDIISGLDVGLYGLKEVFPTLDTEKYFELTSALPKLLDQGGRSRANRLGADYSKVVHDYTTEELISWVNDHSENEWQQKPAWFRAIVDEIERRLNAY